MQASRMPEITLSLPAALGALAVILLIGAAAVYFSLRAGITGATITEPTAEGTATETPTITPTATETLPPPPPSHRDTPASLRIHRPGRRYVRDDRRQSGRIGPKHYCSKPVVVAMFCLCWAETYNSVSNSTPAPPPTDIPNEATQTAQACEKITYTVQANDTLSSISFNYNVPQDAIKFYNGLSTDAVFLGQPLIIPLM